MILHSPIPTEQYSSHTSVFFIWIFCQKVLDVDRSWLSNKESMAWWSARRNATHKWSNHDCFLASTEKNCLFFHMEEPAFSRNLIRKKKQRPLKQHNWQKNILSPAKSANLWYCVFVCLWMCRFHLKLKKFSWSLLCQRGTLAVKLTGPASFSDVIRKWIDRLHSFLNFLHLSNIWRIRNTQRLRATQTRAIPMERRGTTKSVSPNFVV